MFLNPHVPARTEDTGSADRKLAAFLRARITELDTHGCSAERKALAGVSEVLREFEEKYDRTVDFHPSDYFIGQIDTLRWVLEQVALATFSAHPDLRDVLEGKGSGGRRGHRAGGRRTVA